MIGKGMGRKIFGFIPLTNIPLPIIVLLPFRPVDSPEAANVFWL
jgi:hypothetical protein